MSKFPYKIIDLTHALDSVTPTWDGSCGFEHCLTCDYDPNAAYQFKIHKITMKEGIGTHMDAPAHCNPSGLTVDLIKLEDLIVPCVVIDVSAAAHDTYSLSVQDVVCFEQAHGPIGQGSFVMVRTGWDQYWGNADKYRNNHKFPAISKEAAQELLQRGVAGIGIDTLSPDRGDEGFPVHKLFLEAGKYIIENVANLAAMPPTGALIEALPLKIKSGTEAPIRLIGLIA